MDLTKDNMKPFSAVLDSLKVIYLNIFFNKNNRMILYQKEIIKLSEALIKRQILEGKLQI